MKIFAYIIAFGNLLALLAHGGEFLLAYPFSNPSLSWDVILINTLYIIVFLSQRSYARFLARPRTEEEAEAADGGEARFSALFSVWYGWLKSDAFPYVIIAANLILAAVAAWHLSAYVQRYEQLEFSLFYPVLVYHNPHPLFFWILVFLIYKAVLIAANISFNVLSSFGLWRPAYVWVISALLLSALAWSAGNYFPDWYQARRAGIDWPQFGTVTLKPVRPIQIPSSNPHYLKEAYPPARKKNRDNGGRLEDQVADGGPTILVAPPPGYIRIEPDNPALKKFLDKSLPDSSITNYTLVAVFAAAGRSYKETIKNLESKTCAYNCTPGLAWIYQDDSNRQYIVVEPGKTLAENLWPRDKTNRNQRYQLSGPAFFFNIIDHRHSALGYEGVAATDLHINGQVVMSGRLLHVRSIYSVKGKLSEDQREQWVEHCRQWLETLAEANPSPAEIF